MNKVINLSITRKDVPVVFDVVQYTTAPNIEFIITDFNITGANANLYIEKPSGEQIYNACSISGQSIIYKPTTQSFAEEGISKCQLEIVVNNSIAVSFLLLAVVHKNIISSEAVESQSEFTLLQEALLTVNQYDSRILANTTSIDNLNANAVKKNVASQTINGKLTLNSGLASKGSYITISNDGNTENAYETLYFSNINYDSNCMIRAYDINNNGSAMIIKPGGPLILGGGEFAFNYYTDNRPATEQTYLGADTQVNIITNYSDTNPEDPKVWTFNTSGNLIPPTGGLIDGLDCSEVGKEIFNLYGSTIDLTAIESGNTFKNLGLFKIPAGTNSIYIFKCQARFTTNATGVRELAISDSLTGGGKYNLWQENANAVNGAPTTIHVDLFIKGAATEQTFYINVLQNSGRILNASARYACLKIK